MVPTFKVGTLPKLFIFLSFVNFLVGASLGGIMSCFPDVWDAVGNIHGEINPYGWLTMMIYGMTYAVLTVFARVQLPWRFLGWLHCAVAQIAVWTIVLGFAYKISMVTSIGFILQAVAPILFVINILSGVVSTRRRGGSAKAPKESVAARESDVVSRRGSDIALILFIVATIWIAISQLRGSAPTTTALVMVYYGWIAGTVLSVALHMFPRMSGVPWPHVSSSRVIQYLWLLSIILCVLNLMWLGTRVFGVVMILSAINYIRELYRLRKMDRRQLSARPLSNVSLYAFACSWIFAFILGVALLAGMNPLSLAAMHLMFLGWITTLIFGTGYRLFPLFLQKTVKSEAWSLTQILSFVLGASLLIVAFLTPSTVVTQVSMGLGGTIAALSVVLFITRWFFSSKPLK